MAAEIFHCRKASRKVSGKRGGLFPSLCLFPHSEVPWIIQPKPSPSWGIWMPPSFDCRMEKVHLSQDVRNVPLQNVLTVPYFQVFILREVTGKSGTTQRKLSLKLSKLSLLDTFVFSYYKDAFLNLVLSLLMSLLARWDTSKGLGCSFFLLCKRHLCFSLLHADLFLAHLTHANQMLPLMLHDVCASWTNLCMCVFFSQPRGPGSVARRHGQKTSELRSGRLCFPNPLIRDDSTPRQACA